MFAKKNKILYSDWIYEWLIDKKEYIKESTYANYSNNILRLKGFDKNYITILNNIEIKKNTEKSCDNEQGAFFTVQKPLGTKSHKRKNVYTVKPDDILETDHCPAHKCIGTG